MDSADMADPGGMGDGSVMMDPMDDLFGDGAADALGAGDLGADTLNLAMPPVPGAPLPPRLVERMSEMQASGCCTKLAWSNAGILARVSLTGRAIEYYTITRNANTGSWAISDKMKQDTELLEDAPPLVHIEFSGAGVELAAVDALGSLHLFVLNGAIGRMTLASKANAETHSFRNASDRAAGLHWLRANPNEYTGAWVSPATKSDENNQWRVHVNNRDSNQPKLHHPLPNKSALFRITCGGQLTLTFQQEGFGWQSIETELEAFVGSDEFISHAAFGEDGARMLLATCDLAQCLRLYSLAINWNLSKDTRRPGWTLNVVAPELIVSHLTTIEYACPQHASTACLSTLTVLPPVLDVAEPHGPAPATILAVFTHAALSSGITADPTQPHQDSFSVLARWHVDVIKPTLHDSFSKLKGNKASSTDPGTSTILQRQEDTVTSKLILDLQSQYFDTILACGVSDGTVEFRDRVTMHQIDGFGDTTTVSSLAQNNFEHPSGDHSLHLAMSSDASMLAYISLTGKLQTKTIQQRFGWQALDDGISDTKGLIEAAVVCLARQFVIASTGNVNNDEILATLPYDLETHYKQLFVQQVIRMSQRNPDVSLQDGQIQQASVLKDQLMPKALSAQLVLSAKAGSTERTAPGQLAWCLLNFKLVSFGMLQSLGKGDPNPAAINSLRGCIRWLHDLMVFIVDDLLAVARQRPQHESAKAAFEAHITATESPALHLLLCSFSRALIRFVLMWLQRYYALVEQSLSRAQSVTQRQQLQDSADYVRQCPLEQQTFVRIFSDVDGQIRHMYKERNFDASKRMELELSMLTECSIPDEMSDILEQFLSVTMTDVADKSDVGKIYFWPTSWLDLSNHTASAGAAAEYDVIRKLPLAKGVKLRFCKRCCSVSEDVTPEKMREMAPWLALSQRACLCMSLWVLAQ